MPRICCGISIRRFQGEQLNAKARRCEEEKLCVSVPLRLCVEREFLMSTERVSSGAVSSNSPVANTAFATTAFDRLRILEQYRTIAMVGLSSNPFRPSHFAAIYMLAEGYRIIPVNPREKEILGQACYPTLRDIPEKVEIVDIFRGPSTIGLNTGVISARRMQDRK